MKYFGLHLDKAVKGYFTLFNILLKHTQTVNLVSVSHTHSHTHRDNSQVSVRDDIKYIV